jgi:DNA-binding response OmpR family regulator
LRKLNLFLSSGVGRRIQAGATDYLSKPVDQDRLLSLMRVLLSR